MKKVIKFPKNKIPAEAVYVQNLIEDLDHLLNHYMVKGMDPSLIAGVLANRLGAVVDIEDKDVRDKLLSSCLDIALKQTEL